MTVRLFPLSGLVSSDANSSIWVDARGRVRIRMTSDVPGYPPLSCDFLD